MELIEETIPTVKSYGGHTVETITDGKVKLKIGNTEVLDLNVPNGKTWEVNISVYIKET